MRSMENTNPTQHHGVTIIYMLKLQSPCKANLVENIHIQFQLSTPEKFDNMKYQHEKTF